MVDVSGGAASYSIPINLPPGINGIVPEISINYNSASGKGLLGFGWHISGTSEIRRGNKNHVFDGWPDAVNLTSNDRLFLDGQGMYPYNGGNLQSQSLYKTQQESFQRIEMLTSGGFEVQEKNGLKRLYGINNDRRINLSPGQGQSNVPYVWLLERVVDINGNYIEYEYDNDSYKNEAPIKKIRYTGNIEETYSPLAEIEFKYAGRTDISKVYVAGNNVEQTKI